MSKQTKKTAETTELALGGLDALMGLATEAPKTATKTSDKEVIAVADNDIKKAIVEYLDGKKMEQEGLAKKAMAEGILKPFVFRNIWLEKYKKHGLRPESFIFTNGDKASLHFLTISKYRMVKEKTEYQRLIDTYGEEVAQQKVEFKLNGELVQRYGAIIAGLIKNCPDIAPEDKGKLIQASTSFSIASDAIEKLPKFAEKSGADIFQVAQDLGIQQQLKAMGEK